MGRGKESVFSFSCPAVLRQREDNNMANIIIRLISISSFVPKTAICMPKAIFLYVSNSHTVPVTRRLAQKLVQHYHIYSNFAKISTNVDIFSYCARRRKKI